MNIIELKNLKYSYDGRRQVLKNVSAEFEAGKVYAITGPSGCGKTTLLSLIGGLDCASDGEILYEGKHIGRKELVNHRRNNVSFVFQNYNLIDYLTPSENVALVSKLPPLPVLEKVGLSDEESKRSVLKLSGGQQQRVAIARAIASDTKVILADEPTGNLDEDTAHEVAEVITDIAHKNNKCVIIVTHSNDIAKGADVILRLKKGELIPVK